MLIDGRTFAEDESLEADLCIIGGGAAGITLALDFIAQPLRVLVLEAGGLEYQHEVQDLYHGESVGQTYDVHATRLRFFGGSTNHWGGYCRPFEAIGLERRPWIPYSGWPIRLGDLEPYYREAARLCQIGSIDLDAHGWARRLDLATFDFDQTCPLSNLVYQLSPPTRFGEVYREAFHKASNVTVCLHSNVTAIRARHDGQTVDHLEARSLGGAGFRVHARCYVLACGGIENPRLLLASDDVEKGGLGNRHDLVGRFFMEHGHFNLGKVALSDAAPDAHFFLDEIPTEGAARVSAHIGLSAEVQRDEQIAGAVVQLRSRIPTSAEKSLHTVLGALKLGSLPDDLGLHIRRMLSDPGTISSMVRRKVAKKLFGSEEIGILALRSVGEQVPNPDSRVTLGSSRDALDLPLARLDWRLTEVDRRTLARTGELIAAEFGRLGLGRVQLQQDEAEPEPIQGGYHHIGTTRMADDPREGVVDRHCRVHGMGNLYIAGSSVFPASGNGTPTLTIVALALRLAQHLKTDVFV